MAGEKIHFGDESFAETEWRKTLPKCMIHDIPDCGCSVLANNHAIMMTFDHNENLTVIMREVRRYVGDDGMSDPVPTEHVLNIPPWYLHDFQRMLNTMVDLADAGFKFSGTSFEILNDREDDNGTE